MHRLGVIEENECEALKKICTRKTALEELLLAIKDPDTNRVLYDQIVSDFVKSKQRIQDWWDEISSKYNWEYNANDSWEVRFETREVFLNKASDEQ